MYIIFQEGFFDKQIYAKKYSDVVSPSGFSLKKKGNWREGEKGKETEEKEGEVGKGRGGKGRQGNSRMTIYCITWSSVENGI